MLNQDVDTTTKARVTNEYDSRKRILHDKISIFNNRAPLFYAFQNIFQNNFMHFVVSQQHDKLYKKQPCDY